MATTRPATKPPITKPKPRGINVKAFVESVESGSKPQPDFFKGSSVNKGNKNIKDEQQKRHSNETPKPETANEPATTPRKTSLNKPPIMHKKPSLTTSNKPTDIIKPSIPPPAPPPSTSTSGVSPQAEEEVASEDSGHSTCDLKYSGSISSNQSSSHDPHYQALSELDDGYSEHMSSVEGAVTVHEPPQYSDPAAAGITASLPSLLETQPSGSAALKTTHTNHYKYHVPSKVAGTLPRDKKKAAAIGKAVAKGRSTIKKKIVPPANKVEEDTTSRHSGGIKDNTLKASESAADGTEPIMSDPDIYSDEYCDYSDFDSDSDWETDGEQSNQSGVDQTSDNHSASALTNAQINNNDYINTTSSQGPTPLSREESLKKGFNDSDYDTFMEKHGHEILRRKSSRLAETNLQRKSKSHFYDDEQIDLEDSQKLVTLMREHNTKKEKSQRLKRSETTGSSDFSAELSWIEPRLRHLRGNIKDLKDRATVQKQSLVKFIGKKLKKPNVPKPDYALDSETICEEDSDALATSMANKPRQMSTFSTGSHSDSQSDIHSISSHHSSVNLHHSSSSLHHSNSAASADQLPHAFTPRPKASTSSSADVRQKTKSLGALLVPPPLPPRNTRSQYFPSTENLAEDLPPPPPPVRSTSLAVSPSDDGPNVLVNTNLSVCRSDSQASSAASTSSGYTPKFIKARPQASPRSPKVTSQHNDASPRLSISSTHISESTELHKTHSSPNIPSSPEGRTPSVPVRRESCKSLVVGSQPDDESIRRRNEIISSAARTSIIRKSSLNASSITIDEESQTPSLSQSAPAESLSVPSGDSDGSLIGGGNTSHDKLIEDEPLYQEYHECMLSHVKANSISKSGDRTDDDEASTLMRGGQPSLSLWSTTAQVINTGVLDHMNQEEIKLQEAMFEVITSEASYLRSINMLNKIFVNSEAFCNEEILTSRDKKALFSNVLAVQEVSNRLFNELEIHWKQNVILTAVCEIIAGYAHRDLDVYIKYCSNQAFQDRTLKKLLSQNPRFQEAVAQLERSPECHGLSMSSFLLLPMQRITRLPLLLDAILRRQEVWSDQYRTAQLCYEHVKKVVSRCNEGARKMEQTEQVLSIENKLQFSKLKKIPLGASRQLIKKGELLHISMDGGRSASNLLALKPKNLSLMLFNDLLLITKKKGENYAVIDYASRVNVEIEEWRIETLKDPRLSMMANKSQAKFIFMLILLENHQKKHAEFLLACHTETERTRWIEAFTPQGQGDSEDKIYESWDCPQVQATHEYTAQQPDELNLAAGEKINVLRKTADGWYEGEKVSDGQSGWLPASYTHELQNEHVRARNLKNRYKLIQAAAKMMK